MAVKKMKIINFSKLISIVIGLSLILVCSAAAMSIDTQESKALLSNTPVMSAVKENIQKFTGSPIDGINHIEIMNSYVGDVYQVRTVTGDVFSINVKTGKVESASIQLGKEYSLAGNDLSGMKEVAENFVTKHYANFTSKKMPLVESQVIDHGDAGKEYNFIWNEKYGEAFGLSGVSISICPDSNRIYYHAIDRDLLIDTTPKVTQTDAQETARSTYKVGIKAETKSRLLVIPDGDNQKLVWQVETSEHNNEGFSNGGIAIIDAISGKVLSINPYL